MAEYVNELGQVVGVPIPGWQARPRPARMPMEGSFCRVDPLDPERHGRQLYQAIAENTDGRTWTYLAYGPFASEAEFLHWLEGCAASDDPLFHVIVDHASGTALGLVSFLRIDGAAGSISIGHIIFSHSLRRTPAATEGMYLMLRRAFDELGYRRCEWRCDALNTKSRTAAERFGLRLEGIFRQAAVSKGRNRDTAFFSMIDAEWPRIRAGFQTWLSPENFDADGHQRQRLSTLTRPVE